MTSGVNLQADNEEKIVAALAAAGVTCSDDDRVAELCRYHDYRAMVRNLEMTR